VTQPSQVDSLLSLCLSLASSYSSSTVVREAGGRQRIVGDEGDSFVPIRYSSCRTASNMVVITIPMVLNPLG
jgi:hypothetical protein